MELDRYEGVASGCYEKRAIHAAGEGGEGGEGESLVYASLRTPVTMETFRAGYLDRCLAASRELGLDGAMARLAEVRVVG